MTEHDNSDLLFVKEEQFDFDELEDINELIRQAEEIIQENRTRNPQTQEPSDFLTQQVNEILQEPEEPEEEPSPDVIPDVIPADDDDDDDVIFVNSTPGPEIIDLSDPTPPRFISSRRTFNVDEIRTRPDSPIILSSRRRQRFDIPDVSPTKTSGVSTELDQSQDDSFSKVRLQCPICMESAVNKNPSSTVCGHIFCEACIIQAIKLTKKCPMCKKHLKSKNSIHRLYF